MMIAKRIFILAMTLALLFTSVCFAQDTQTQKNNEPLKVVILPTVSSYGGYNKVMAQLDRDLARTLHMPLNGVLQSVDYLDMSSNENRVAVENAMSEAGYLLSPNATTLKKTADILGADVIVGYSVPVMYQQIYYTSFGLYGGPTLNSYITLKLWAYYRPLDKTVALSNSQSYFQELSPQGYLTELASDAAYYLNKKADLKTLLKQSIDVKANTAEAENAQKGDV